MQANTYAYNDHGVGEIMDCSGINTPTGVAAQVTKDQQGAVKLELRMVENCRSIAWKDDLPAINA